MRGDGVAGFGGREADAGDGKFSITLPLARALIGKTAGDVVEVTTPSGGKSYEIIEVSFVAAGGE